MVLQALLESNMVDTIQLFMKNSDADVVYAGHALIMNILTSHGIDKKI